MKAFKTYGTRENNGTVESVVVHRHRRHLSCYRRRFHTCQVVSRSRYAVAVAVVDDTSQCRSADHTFLEGAEQAGRDVADRILWRREGHSRSWLAWVLRRRTRMTCRAVRSMTSCNWADHPILHQRIRAVIPAWALFSGDGSPTATDEFGVDNALLYAVCPWLSSQSQSCLRFLTHHQKYSHTKLKRALNDRAFGWTSVVLQVGQGVRELLEFRVEAFTPSALDRIVFRSSVRLGLNSARWVWVITFSYGHSWSLLDLLFARGCRREVLLELLLMMSLLRHHCFGWKTEIEREKRGKEQCKLSRDYKV